MRLGKHYGEGKSSWSQYYLLCNSIQYFLENISSDVEVKFAVYLFYNNTNDLIDNNEFNLKPANHISASMISSAS